MLMRANAFFACLLCSSVVGAQSVLPDEYVGTARTGADVLYTRGQFAGCSMQFAATVKDTAYERGDIVAVRGSLLFNVFQGAQSKYLMPALRIGVFRINGNGVLTAATPDFVYAESSGGSTASITIDSAPSDVPGYVNAALKMEPPVFGLIADASIGRPITIGYSRGSNGVDQRLQIDLSVVETKIEGGKILRVRSKSQAQAFERCFTRVVESIAPKK